MDEERMRRGEQLHVLLTPEEADALRSKAESFGMTRSEFVRFAVEAITAGAPDEYFAMPSIVLIDSRTWRHILTELRVQGSNLNQAVRACNSMARAVVPYLTTDRPDIADLDGFSLTLESVEDELEMLVEGNRKLEGMFSGALSTDAMIGTGRGWRRAPAEG